jgi:hypothetical protein
VQYFKYFRSRITNDAESARGGESMTAMAKEVFSKKKDLYHIITLDINLRTKLVKWYI